MNKRQVISIAALAAMLVGPQVASAHPGHGGDFSAGLLHPITGLDHLLAMVAVGIWAAQLGGRAIVLLPCTFVTLMIVGGMVSSGGYELPYVESFIAASVVALGLLVCFAAKLPLQVGCAIVGVFAMFHGHAHVAELSAGGQAAVYTLGFALSTAALHLAGIGTGMLLSRGFSVPVARYCGGVIIAIGALIWTGLL